MVVRLSFARGLNFQLQFHSSQSQEFLSLDSQMLSLAHLLENCVQSSTPLLHSLLSEINVALSSLVLRPW